MSRFEDIAAEVGKTVAAKNDAYGDAAATSAEAFKLLFPNGIPTEKYQDALLLIRVWDKMKRIATKKDALGEDPWKDISGYAVLGAAQEAKYEYQYKVEYTPSLTAPEPLKYYAEGMGQDVTIRPVFTRKHCAPSCTLCAAEKELGARK